MRFSFMNRNIKKKSSKTSKPSAIVRRLRKSNKDSQRRIKLQWLLFILGILFFISMLLLIWFEVLHPAWLSYSYVCIPGTAEKLASEGIYAAGIASLSPIGATDESSSNSYNSNSESINSESSGETPSIDTSKISIVIDIKYANDRLVHKHELCHAQQYFRGWITACSDSFKKIGKEAECHLTDSLPDPVFEKVYGMDIDESIKELVTYRNFSLG